ncbi:DUF3955 domain-containing protein [Microbulbifer echini]|uniref:DUF3955 domain-containing protein n=1 Tax=Microbulbifer echini TaxID=1529067 RepID=A0ABV4NL27_9GAMM
MVLIIFGGLSLLAFWLIGSSIDSEGILREPFALLPLGLLILLSGAVITVIGIVRRKHRQVNSRIR